MDTSSPWGAVSFNKLFVLWFAFYLSHAQSFALDFGQVVDEGQQRAVVALALFNTEQQSVDIICTGVAIGSRVILTAAHCLQEAQSRMSTRERRHHRQFMRILVSSGFSKGKALLSSLPERSVYKIADFHIHPDYQRSFRGQADIAVVRLHSDLDLLPEEYPRLALNSVWLKKNIRRGSLLQATGFGWAKQSRLTESRAQQEYGIKRTASLLITGKTGSELLVAPGPAKDPAGRLQPRPREGDSGGPLFLTTENESILVGLVSRATLDRSQTPVTAYSLIRPYICWIQQAGQIKIDLQSHVDYCSREFTKSANSRPVKDFISECLREQSLHVADRYTLDVLRDLFPNAKDCLDLYRILSQQQRLDLDMTFIKSLSLLQPFQNIFRISARDNLIETVELYGFPQLMFLDLSYNNIRNWNFKIGNNETWLIGQERQIHNLGRTRFIQLCGQRTISHEERRTILGVLETLGLTERDCVNANYELARARSLHLKSDLALTDLSPLEGLVALEHLDVSSQKIKDLSFLKGLQGLNSLVVDYNPIQYWEGLGSIANLQRLSAKGVGLQDLSFLKWTPRLQVLDISYNSIKSFSESALREERGTLQILGRDQQLR